MNVSPGSAEAGDTVQRNGNFFNKNPVLIHFGALDGPVVATLMPVGATINGAVTVPRGRRPGSTCSSPPRTAPSGPTRGGVPVRALVSVAGDSGPAPVLSSPAPLARTAGLTRSSSAGGGTLVLTGLGGAGVALLLAGLGTNVAGARRRPERQAEAVKASR